MVRFVVSMILLGVPGCLLVLKAWVDRRKDPAESAWSDIPRQTALLFLASYVLWWADLGLGWIKPSLHWTAGFGVGWPLFGTVISVLGLGLSFLARKQEKLKLFIANFLFAVLSLCSAVAPN